MNEDIMNENNENMETDPLADLLSVINLEDEEDDEGNDVVLSANMITSIKVNSEKLQGVTVSQAYLMHADRLGIDPESIVMYLSGNKVVTADTELQPNTSYRVIIRNQHKG